MEGLQLPPQKRGLPGLASKIHQGHSHTTPNRTMPINALQRSLWASLTLSNIILSPEGLRMKDSTPNPINPKKTKSLPQ